MTNILKFIVGMAVVIGCAFAGFSIGCWWPVRDVPSEDIWAGDGIGMMLGGAAGFLIGGIGGGYGLLLIISLTRWYRARVKLAKPRNAWSLPDE